MTEDDVYNGFFIPKGRYSWRTSLFRCWLICTFQMRRWLRMYGAIFVLSFSTSRLQLFGRAILHDPVVYPEPDIFKPERFINSDGTLNEDPVMTSLFGFGKRICPGRHLADATLFIAIASLLSVFNFKKGNGTDGGPDMYLFTGGAIRCGYRVSLMAWGIRRADFPFLVVRALSPAPSSQGTEWQRKLSSPISGLRELPMSFGYLVFHFFTKAVLCQCDMRTSSL
jgi:hypothetical protein